MICHLITTLSSFCSLPPADSAQPQDLLSDPINPHTIKLFPDSMLSPLLIFHASLLSSPPTLQHTALQDEWCDLIYILKTMISLVMSFMFCLSS